MFKFRLERVLQLRISEENQLKLELASVRARMRILQEEINSAQQMLYKMSQEVLQDPSRGLSGNEIHQWRSYVEATENYIRKKLQDLKNLKSEEDRLKEKYLEMRKDRKILENLKAKQFKRYAFEQDRLNRLYMDEIALRKYARR
ncbi:MULTISPECIES: flagellar export protein FliJ [Pseudothermotoga]|jgi:flagellar FliJ protein|uniref:Flagellar FliJ protein n=1 Tax=Pseudothermotoga lettingae (strain ATCC BAA-301 / DSM 14385 / NBRC 107922 / TMO) TaxID=416591 RepID=A8F7A1_PSELT|nr:MULTISPECIES: flagellar export protein FliJ [Pseudothermotoga]ABV34035.1 flagellar export protein FliJ [Pseudothermotoga lettingae TMO]KUK21391.1 MAG: Flagellar export protein FliJ [Pseudothermotoga lettingae]MDI3494838.1 flagellar protein FliJ [Pseudothermotoga sp.]MDK2884660.1 flagellar protein FliJ [Pseudothermotoga sp.]GLI49026.1 hypothetical protein PLETTINGATMO_11950 [Pseudothermotoga lettingae TMO]